MSFLASFRARLYRPSSPRVLAIAKRAVSEPGRQECEPRVRPVLETVVPRIEILLEQWRWRTTKKQRLTGSRIHQQLIEEGY